jgi:hypothetical protein
MAKIKRRELAALKEAEWDADNDIEAICNIYLEYLWSASTTTLMELKAERLKIKIAAENKKLEAKKKQKKKRDAEDKAKDAEMASSMGQTGMNTTLNSVKFSGDPAATQKSAALNQTKTEMSQAAKTMVNMEVVKETAEK